MTLNDDRRVGRSEGLSDDRRVELRAGIQQLLSERSNLTTNNNLRSSKTTRKVPSQTRARSVLIERPSQVDAPKIF